MRFGHKYHAKPTIYNGVRYASKAEAARAQMLDALVRQGAIRWWIGQPTFRLGCAENVYRPDFLIQYADGHCECEDVKGVETAKFRHDKKLWASHGRMKLRILKRRHDGFLVHRVIIPDDGHETITTEPTAEPAAY